jgi:hypothetical protein
MASGSQLDPEYGELVHQLMHDGWYRAGSGRHPGGVEWGFRAAPTVDAETALLCWISAVDEQGTMLTLCAELLNEQVIAALGTADSV